MDPSRYSTLRHQVINTMNKHASCRRRNSCPEVEIPDQFKKTIQSLKKEHIDEIEEHLGEVSPKVSPKIRHKEPSNSHPSAYDFTQELLKRGIIIVKNEKNKI